MERYRQTRQQFHEAVSVLLSARVKRATTLGDRHRSAHPSWKSFVEARREDLTRSVQHLWQPTNSYLLQAEPALRPVYTALTQFVLSELLPDMAAFEDAGHKPDETMIPPEVPAAIDSESLVAFCDALHDWIRIEGKRFWGEDCGFEMPPVPTAVALQSPQQMTVIGRALTELSQIRTWWCDNMLDPDWDTWPTACDRMERLLQSVRMLWLFSDVPAGYSP